MISEITVASSTTSIDLLQLDQGGLTLPLDFSSNLIKKNGSLVNYPSTNSLQEFGDMCIV
jgi:hypothetical protein